VTFIALNPNDPAGQDQPRAPRSRTIHGADLAPNQQNRGDNINTGAAPDHQDHSPQPPPQTQFRHGPACTSFLLWNTVLVH
jgi:hypothetical protein